MISKEAFVAIMESIEEAYDENNAFCDALEPFFTDNQLAQFKPLDDLILKVTEALAKELEPQTFDSDTDCIISYWMWDLRFGKNTSIGIYINDKKIDLSSADKLYDYLLEERCIYEERLKNEAI